MTGVAVPPTPQTSHSSGTVRAELLAPASGATPSRSDVAWTQHPVRVALLVDGPEVPAWADQALRDAIGGGWAVVALVVVNESVDADSPDAGPQRGMTARLGRWWKNRDVLPYAAYQRFDTKRYTAPDDPGRPRSIAELAGDAPVVRVRPRQTKFCDYFADEVVDEILAHDVDVAVRLGFRILKGRALEIARYGVWSFHHGDNRINRGGPPGFWEVLEGHPETGAVLQRLTEELDAGVVLGRSRSSTVPTSVAANRANYYWQAAQLLTSALRRLSTGGPVNLTRAADRPDWNAYSQRFYTAPRAREMAAGALRLASLLVRRKLGTLWYGHQWFLAYRFAPGGQAAEGGTVHPDRGAPDGAPFRFKEVIPPEDRYWADPFPVTHEGRHYVFFEDHPIGAPNAHISVAEVDPKTGFSDPRVVLRRDYHLSYPSVFQWQGEWYMTPETYTQGAVELFRCTRFPDEWEYVGDLLTNVPAVDSTIAEIDGRWWMFVGMLLPGTLEASALHLYHAPSPLGPWTAHGDNPVRIDARTTRPAGRVFHHGGAYYRPAQDGVPTYGSAIVIHRIDELTPTTFRETLVSRLDPSWRPGLVGTHTINAAGRLTFIDVLRRVPRRRLRARS